MHKKRLQGAAGFTSLAMLASTQSSRSNHFTKLLTVR